MKKFWIAIIIVVVIIVGFFFIRKKLTSTSQQPQFTVTEVTRGNIEVKVLATGTIQPYTRVEVNSPVSGRIDQVLVDEGDMVKPGDILAWISSEDRIALLDAARSALESAQRSKDETAIKEALQAYEVANNAYKPVPLTNSIKGEVINRAIEPGQNVTTQTVLFVISDRLVANVSVDEADIGKITLNQDATIVLDAFPDESVPAKVTKISREAKVVSDVVVYNVMVEPVKVQERWASGMTANVSFFVVNKQNVLTLPSSAIKERNGEKFVMVLSSNRPDTRRVQRNAERGPSEVRQTTGAVTQSVQRLKEAEPRKIITGVTDGKTVEVIKGIEEGDKVVITPGSFQGQTRPGSDAERRMRQMMRGLR